MFTLSLAVFVCWLAFSLVGDTGGESPLIQVESRALGGAEGRAVEALRPATTDTGRDAVYRDYSEYLLKISPGAGVEGPFTLEVQRAHAPMTSAWYVRREAGQIIGLVPLTALAGARGTLVPLPSFLGDSPELLIAARNLGRLQPRLKAIRAIETARVETHHRYLAGATLGVMLFLATFGSLVAAIGSDRMFFYFAAWSLTSLRSVAVNEGWATSWLFATLPDTLVPIAQGGTLALHILVSLLLAGTILGSRSTVGPTSRRIWHTLCGLSMATVVCAPLAGSPLYYPAVWSVAAGAMVYILTTLALAFRDRLTAVNLWYSAFWVVTLAGQGGEIAYAAGLVARPLPLLSVQSGAILGALMMAMTMAEYFFGQMRERRRAKRAELDALRQLASTYEFTPIGLFRLDDDGAVVMYNPTFAALFALKRPGLMPVPLRDLLGADGLASINTAVERGVPVAVTLRARPGEPRERHFSLMAHRSPEGIEGSISDVTSRVLAERRLEYLIDHDSLTGALNQRGLSAVLDSALVRAGRGEASAYADLHIDRFKLVNDLYGLATGDALLSAVHERIRRDEPPGLQVARVGDTFKLVLDGYDGEASRQLAQRVIHAIGREPFVIEGKSLNLTASVGLVSISDEMSARDVMTAASHASADARSNGRNRIVQSLPEDLAMKEYFEDLSVQATLKDRLESDRFFLEFQPIVNLRDAGQSLSFEALVRMRDDQGKVISPGRFIPSAERNGQISMIDRWVLKSTLSWLATHPRQTEALNYVTVNLSGASLNDARFIDDTVALISSYPQLCRKICFEVTETVALADRRATRLFADRVHSLGGYIALDDFGAGYTSFTYLKELDADIIKIDGSFVRDLHNNPQNYAITRTITELAHQLGKRCIAEWVEEPATVAALMKLGVDYAQGFILCPPQSPNAFLGIESTIDLVKDAKVRALLKGDGIVAARTAAPASTVRSALS